MTDIELSGLRKVYRDDDEEIVAVNNVSLTVHEGELLVLVGPSGSGKTTILRTIAGLDSVTSGNIWIGGREVTGLEPRKRNVAMVFQDFTLYPSKTVRQNMRFGLKMSTDMTRRERDEKVEEVADLLNITKRLNNTPDQLSGGEKQRVALGRAIVRDPDVFLLDEPLSNLDARLRDQMRTEVHRIQEELGVTTIYVTHNQTEAMTVGDRLAILREGKLQQVGAPMECFYEPANQFVARFLSHPEMNIFQVDDGDGYGLDYPLPNNVTGTGLSENIVIGARPEVINVTTDASGEFSFPATVEMVEPLGTKTYVYFTLNDLPTKDPYIASVEGYTGLSAGEPIRIVIPPAEVHVFDASTGEAIRNRDTKPSTPGSFAHQ